MIETLFYVSAFLSAYSYFVYPLILMAIPARKTLAEEALSTSALPRLSLIIAAHNEEHRIEEKLQNTLSIDYPAELMEIIVASDCSSDSTDKVVSSFADRGIQLVRVDERKGKEFAQLCGIRQSKGEILVFSDVGTQIPEDALKKLASAFSSERVGAVSSEDRFIDRDGRPAGEGAYVKYEMWLRRIESGRAGLVGLSGSFFAARREVCNTWDTSIDSDFNIAINCKRRGKLAISHSDVLGHYPDIENSKQEYMRKVRTVIRGMTAIPRNSWALNPFQSGLFAFELWSHKILRWGVPWFILIFVATAIMLQGSGVIYSLALGAVIVFFAFALAGWMFEWARRFALVRLAFFFVQTNLAIAHAAVAFILGKRITTWTPSRR